MQPRPRTWSMTTRAAAVLAAGLLFLGACSSGDDDAGDTTTTTEAGSDETTTTLDGDDEGASDAEGDEGSDPDSDSADDDSDDSDDGTDDGSSVPAGDQGHVDAIAASLDESLVGDRATATCIGERWVSIIGSDEIQAASVEPSSLGDGDFDAWSSLGLDADRAQDVYGAFGACDFDAREALIADMIEGEDAATKDCIDATLTDAVIADYLVQNFQGTDDGEDLFGLLEDCAPDE